MQLKNILALAILYASSQTCVFLIMGVYLKLRKYAWDSTIMPFTCFTICHIYPNLDEEKKTSKKYHSWQMIQYYCKKIKKIYNVVQLKKGRKAV